MNKGTAANLVLAAIGMAALVTLFNQGMKMAGRFSKPTPSLAGGKVDLGAGKAPALKDLQNQLIKGLGRVSSGAEDDVATQQVSVPSAPIPTAPPAPVVIVRYVYVNQPASGTIAVAQQSVALPGTDINSNRWPRMALPPVQKFPLGQIPEPTRIR